MLLRIQTYGRAGLLGNPSDGYFGKTIALALAAFPVTVTIYESPEIHIEPNVEDNSDYRSLEAMVSEIDRFGYYGGLRLVKATCRQFFKYCQTHDIAIPERNFTLRYQSTVPQLVGMGGSSAICTGVFKALVAFYDVNAIPLEIMPTLCWRAEDELGISCGMQDRVIQIYNGLVYMDFDEQFFTSHQYGRYERLDHDLLPPLYLAYDPNRAEFSGNYHKKLRVLYDAQKQDLAGAMREFADLAERGKQALLARNHSRLAELINANFDLRCRVLPVSEMNARMVFQARKSGASAKFTGSGGAIIGTYDSELMYDNLRHDLEEIGCAVMKVKVAGC
ncbi:MAG: GHMP kinase [Lentisphaeria bacterium]|jgi:glucuronokinase|nr:GHMP kinase [Lentisphaeria bacterium]